MLNEPITLNDGTVDTIVNRIGTSPNGATYRSADGGVALEITHAYKRRNRHTIRLVHTKTVPDELVPTVNASKSMTIYLVVDTPTLGYDLGDISAVFAMFQGVLSAETGAAFTKILSGQS